MNNVIPLKRPEHVISDAELDRLASDISRFANKHAGSMCLSSGIRKLLSDALKKKDPGEDLISTPQHVKEKLWREHFGLNQEKADGEDEFPPAG